MLFCVLRGVDSPLRAVLRCPMAGTQERPMEVASRRVRKALIAGLVAAAVSGALCLGLTLWASTLPAST